MTKYTGYQAIELINNGISVAEEKAPHIEYFKDASDNVIKTFNNRTGNVEAVMQLSEFLNKEFVTVMDLLKVGEYVKVAHGGNGFSKEGDILQLKSVSGVGGFETKKLDGKYGGFKYTYNLVRATDAEVLAAKQSLLKEGGLAKVIANTNNHEFPIGEIVKLEKERRKGTADVYFKSYYLDGHDWWCVRPTDLLPLTAEEVAEMEQKEKEEKERKEKEAAAKKLREQQAALKVGDIVKVLENGSHGFKAGDVLRIYDIVSYGQNQIRCERLDGKRISKDYFYNSELALATDAEVLAAKKALLTKGSYVKVTCRGFNTNVQVGDIVKIVTNDSSRIPFEIETLEGKELGWIPAADVEPVTDAEVKESKAKLEEERKAEELRKKWDEIGREVGEIKAGDIVRVIARGSSDFKVGELATVQSACKKVAHLTNERVKSHNANCLALKRFELVVPVEQRFDKTA
jgi:hypothetical protein